MHFRHDLFNWLVNKGYTHKGASRKQISKEDEGANPWLFWGGKNKPQVIACLRDCKENNMAR